MITWFVRARDSYFAQPRWKFETITVGLAIASGLLLMPALIYIAGRFTLGSYANGEIFALYGDFLGGLVEPRLSNWVVLLGPLAFLSLFRLFRFLLRKL